MNNLLDHILETEDIFKPIAKEEIPVRRRQYLKSIFDKVKITKNKDGTVDIEGDLYLHDIGITSLLDLPYKIRKITGIFDCSFNEFTSLEGAPKEVTCNFSCCDNKLITLKGAPEYVGKDFICQFNQLTSLEGAPKSVGGDFFCNYNELLKKDVDVPSEVKGKIYR